MHDLLWRLAGSAAYLLACRWLLRWSTPRRDWRLLCAAADRLELVVRGVVAELTGQPVALAALAGVNMQRLSYLRLKWQDGWFSASDTAVAMEDIERGDPERSSAGDTAHDADPAC